MSGLALDQTRTIIDELLAEQQRLTAVERFARRHEAQSLNLQSEVYRDLLPARGPSEGEQYAFAVDLDACSGCKACVTACHNLNGLDEDETWRSVGLLQGPANEGGFLQTVTTACHHCIDPACLNGCPVMAYEKEPVTGIVRHLDDQCIGCQYCILKCPYDVPKYSHKRGIVRKCDMCANRLAVSEPPACAQACPNGAISISVVKRAAIAAQASEGIFLPGTPDPAYTKPTTQYRTRRGLPSSLIPADAHALRPAQSHPALVAMLVLTQLSVGAFCFDTLLEGLFPANLMMQLSPVHSAVALAVGLLALATSTLHLGRPWAAWRAVIGLRTSWLSREIVLFGLFAGLAMLSAAGFWLTALRRFSSAGAGMAVAITGILGVFCSVMIYHDTRRPFWMGWRSGFKFYGTTLVLGAATALFVTTVQAMIWPRVALDGAYEQLTRFLSGILVAAGGLKLVLESLALYTPPRGAARSLKQTAHLLKVDLIEITTSRLLLGLIGTTILPLAFLIQRPAPAFPTLGVTVGIMAFTLLGELLERHLFFVAVVPARMPGGIDG
jgi:Fe-S-cluster-containing dehydrogenase component/DMSO reductase anchor subunit